MESCSLVVLVGRRHFEGLLVDELCVGLFGERVFVLVFEQVGMEVVGSWFWVLWLKKRRIVGRGEIKVQTVWRGRQGRLYAGRRSQPLVTVCI